VWVCFIGCLHPDIYRVNRHGRGRVKVKEGKAIAAEQKYDLFILIYFRIEQLS
jgi:hypothetical protein